MEKSQLNTRGIFYLEDNYCLPKKQTRRDENERRMSSGKDFRWTTTKTKFYEKLSSRKVLEHPSFFKVNDSNDLKWFHEYRFFICSSLVSSKPFFSSPQVLSRLMMKTCFFNDSEIEFPAAFGIDESFTRASGELKCYETLRAQTAWTVSIFFG